MRSIVALVLLAILVTLSVNAPATQAGNSAGYLLNVTLGDTAAGASTGLTIEMTQLQRDVLAHPVVAYIPAEWNIAFGGAIDIGAGSGMATDDITTGLANSACNVELPVTFDLMNASVDTSETVSMSDEDHNGNADYADDTNGNGFSDGIDRYPEFLNRLFPSLHPRLREAGITPIAGIPIMLQVLIFAPGTPLFPNVDHDPALGYPAVILWNDRDDPDLEHHPSIINDYCTPEYSRVDLAGRTNDVSEVILTNPDLGDYNFASFFPPLPDADGDGYENELDTCPTTPNVGNPRITNDGDLDSDGLDVACDPNDNPHGGTQSDQDVDGYQNRDDNCPLVANGDVKDDQLDADADGIGNACDPNPQTVDGAVAAVRRDATVHVGAPHPNRPGDANCDGTVGIPDAFVILEYAAGLSPALPPECPPPNG